MSASLLLLRELHASHENMSRMARELDWDSLEREWQDSESNLAALMKISLTDFTGNERSEAQQLALNLLKLQKLISGQVKPWLDQVRPLLESFEHYPLTPDNT